MAHSTLIARGYAGKGKSLFMPVEFGKNHRPIPIEGATYYLRPSCGNRRPINVGKDVTAAYTALLNANDDKLPERTVPQRPARPPIGDLTSGTRKTLEQAAIEYIERSKDKSRKTYIGYRSACGLFLASCKKTYFDEIRRDDMRDYRHFLEKYISPKTHKLIGPSTIFNYFLKTIVFLNDCGIRKYVEEEDWVQKKDWPVNVDKRNKNKKYATYTREELTAMLDVAESFEEALIRFLVGTGFRIGEAAVAQWKDINWKDRTIKVLLKPEFQFKPKDWEERTVTLSDTLLDCLKKCRAGAPDDSLIFPSPRTGTVDKHLDRIVNRVIDKANEVGYKVKKPKKLDHAFRVLYGTRRTQNFVDIETLRDELGHADIATTQIYLRSADTQSPEHRARINKADTFSLPYRRKSARQSLKRGPVERSTRRCRSS